MARKLTTPISPAESAIVEQAVQFISIKNQRKPDGTNTGTVSDTDSVEVAYQVAKFRADGKIDSVDFVTVKLADWSPQLQAMVRNLLSWCDGDAETRGVALPGSTSDDV